jgi:hypothetical protein
MFGFKKKELKGYIIEEGHNIGVFLDGKKRFTDIDEAYKRIDKVLESIVRYDQLEVAVKYCRNLIDLYINDDIKDDLYSYTHDKSIEMTYRRK